ncbi:uncharacterized protein [Misgurnus anguillicaudatus]|uniref:uncharacterized protein n=1 Tax=Misgurnus anguillicaudatus TaxID=75329 RepID=UPI003CCFDEE2
MLYRSLVFCLCFWTLGVFGVEACKVKSMSVMEGDSVTLHTDITELQSKDEIGWWFNNMRIARIKRSRNINPIYEDHVTQIFKDRLKMNNQTGDLNITNIRSEHTGLYQLDIYINTSIVHKCFNFTLTVNARHNVSNAGGLQSNNRYLLIYCTAATAGSLMILTAVLIFWIYRKQKKRHKPDQSCNDEITYADPTFYKRKTKTKRVENEDDVVYAGVVTKR